MNHEIGENYDNSRRDQVYKNECPGSMISGRGIRRESGLERETRAELDFAFGIIGSECQRCSTGSNRSRCDESVRMRCAGVTCANNIIDAGVVGAIGKVERFGDQLEVVMIAEANVSAKA